jgi:outer membrane protein OmpA-like peptidoglycan-associated protein
VLALLAVLAAAALGGCNRESGGAEGSVVVATGADPALARTYDPTRPPVPLTAVETGGGRIDLVGLWRQGPFVRLAVATTATADDFDPSGRFGPLLRTMGGALLVDPAHRTVHPVLSAPGSPTTCLCTTTVASPRRRSLYHADFRVPTDIGEVLVLGDSVPPFGRVRIATVEPDLAGAGYSWLGEPPPPLGARPYDEDESSAPVLDLIERPGAGTSAGADEESITVPDLAFASGTSDLPAAARGRIAEVADRLRALPANSTLTVVGHTDNQGSERANADLSRRRAQAVAEELRARLGRPDLNLRAEGRGESQPLVPNTRADGQAVPANQARNRRVEIVVPKAALAASGRPGAAGDPGLPPDAARVTPAAGELAAIEVVPDTATGDRVQVGIERVQAEPDLRLVRVDLRLEFTGSTRRAGRRSISGDEALTEPGSDDRNGARDLRLVDLQTGAVALPSVDDLDHCLCPDQQSHLLMAGAPDHISVWFPAPPAGTAAVNLLVPRAGLLRDLRLT